MYSICFRFAAMAARGPWPSVRKAIFGGSWSSSLVRNVYDDRENEVHRHVSTDLEAIIRENTINSNSILNSRITKVTSFSHDLSGIVPYVLSGFSKNLVHHFIEIETECGHIFTIEKINECIMEQLCSHPGGDAIPVVRRKRGGKDRPQLLQLVVEDPEPRNKTLLDVIRWINEADELNEPYHVTDSNCQDFSKNLWHKLSEKPYPNPAKIRDSSMKAPTNTQIGQSFSITLFD